MTYRRVLSSVIAALATAAACWPALDVQAQASDRVYRCGNEYTNRPVNLRDCKLVDGGNVTVVHGTRPQAAPAPGASSSASSSAASPASVKVDSGEQRARDADARAIMEGEMRRTEARQAELLKEYNKGEPDKQGGEARNHQKYLDRVAELKANIARNESDMEGIKRELTRLGAPAAGSAASSAAK